MWTPSVLQAFLAIVTVVFAALIGLGQWNITKQKAWREAAEGNAALAGSVKAELEHTRGEMIQAIDSARKDRELLTVQIQALQGQLSLVQRDHEADRERTEKQIARLMRQNHILQVQLDSAERTSVKQHHELQERLTDLPDRQLADDLTFGEEDP